VVARFRAPPGFVKSDGLPPNHLRFRISPEMTIAIGATVMGPGYKMEEEFVEIVASTRPCPQEMEAYELLLGDAMAGDGTLFARQDYVEEAWRIVAPVLNAGPAPNLYERGSWGPKELEQRLSPPGGWVNPAMSDQQDFRILAQAHA
jgi:glucose-6-phosphate 1-dehydrogenase